LPLAPTFKLVDKSGGAFDQDQNVKVSESEQDQNIKVSESEQNRNIKVGELAFPIRLKSLEERKYEHSSIVCATLTITSSWI
jgi:hypothetical protein